MGTENTQREKKKDTKLTPNFLIGFEVQFKVKNKYIFGIRIANNKLKSLHRTKIDEKVSHTGCLIISFQYIHILDIMVGTLYVQHIYCIQ